MNVHRYIYTHFYSYCLQIKGLLWQPFYANQELCTIIQLHRSEADVLALMTLLIKLIRVVDVGVAFYKLG